MNIEKIAETISSKVVNHLRNQADGHGYFYLDQEWHINKIVAKTLEEMKIPINDDIIRKGDRVYLPKKIAGMAAEAYADATISSIEGSYYEVKWNKKNPNLNGQSDGGYLLKHFKKIDRDYEINFLLDSLMKIKNAQS